MVAIVITKVGKNVNDGLNKAKKAVSNRFALKNTMIYDRVAKRYIGHLRTSAAKSKFVINALNAA